MDSAGRVIARPRLRLVQASASQSLRYRGAPSLPGASDSSDRAATEIDVATIENRGRMAIMSSREKHVSVCCSTKASCCIVIVLNNPRCVWSKWIVCREHFILYIPLFPLPPFPSLLILLFSCFFFSCFFFSERHLFVLDRQTDISYFFSYIYCIYYISVFHVVYAQAMGLQHAGVFKLIAILGLVIEDICGLVVRVPRIGNYHEAIIIANSCTQ